MSINKVLWAISLQIKTIPSRVLIQLCDHYNDNTGACYPSIKSLQQSCCLSRQGVINSLKWLEEQKIIEVDRSNNKSNQYKINTNWSSKLTSQENRLVNEVDHGGQVNGLGVVNEVDQGSQRGRPEPVSKQEYKPVIKPDCAKAHGDDVNSLEIKQGEYYDKPPYSPNDNSPEAISHRVIEYLNEKTGRNFKQVKSNHKFIAQRLKYEQADEYTLKRIVDCKVNEWTSDKMKMYLRPQTLFAKDNYLKYCDELEVREKENNEMVQLIEDMKDPNWINPIEAMRRAYAEDTTTY